jgi:hypothetical protein
MLAARAASAPTRNASYRWAGAPAPPLATTGMFTARLTASSIGRSYPFLVPSASIDVRTISPAPSSSTRLAQATASSPVGTRPPLTWTSQTSSESPPAAAGGLWFPPFFTRFGSMLTTVAQRPNFRATSRIRSGFFTAAEFRLTFSAPAGMIWVASARVRMPPPTVNGMKTVSATRRIMSSRTDRPSWLAEMSRKTSSSAPWASYRRATSTGSPASRSPTKLVPFTTRPRSTSRHGMIRLVSIGRCTGRVVDER